MQILGIQGNMLHWIILSTDSSPQIIPIISLSTNNEAGPSQPATNGNENVNNSTNTPRQQKISYPNNNNNT